MPQREQQACAGLVWYILMVEIIHKRDFSGLMSPGQNEREKEFA